MASVGMLMKKIRYNRQLPTFLALALLLVVLLPLANSKVIFHKEAPLEISLNKSFGIQFIFKNLDENNTAHCKVTQQFSNIIPVTKNFTLVRSGPVSLVIYSFDVDIPPATTEVYTINISLPYMPISGTYTLPKAKVVCDEVEYGDVSLMLKVNCNRNYKCEGEIGENPYNCPEDCQLEEVAFEKQIENIDTASKLSQLQHMGRDNDITKITENQDRKKHILIGGTLILLATILVIVLIFLVGVVMIIRNRMRSRKKGGQ